MATFFLNDGNLASVALAPPDDTRIPEAGLTGTRRRIATTWNQFGGLFEAWAVLAGVDDVGAAVATLTVESGGRAFAEDGQMIIRFENHIFWDRWGSVNPARFDEHFRFSREQRWMRHVSRAQPGELWAPFHGNQRKEWTVFERARALDPDQAMRSISMGAPQIMGFNAERIGYPNVPAMFDAFQEPRAQIIGFFDFVGGGQEESTLLRAIRRNDFHTFARGYNGSGQVETYAPLIASARAVFHQLRFEEPPSPIAPGEYRIESGDSLGAIADRFAVDLPALAELNGIQNINQIVVGQILRIPEGAGQAETNPAPDLPIVTPVRAGEHVVEKDESLGEIAKLYGVSVELLSRINDVEPNANLKDRVLRIPTLAGSVIGVSAEPRMQTHEVKPGDTLGALARRFGTSVEELAADNDIEDPSLIRVGDILHLRSPDRG